MRNRGTQLIALVVAAGLVLSVAAGIMMRRHEERVIGAHLGVNASLWADSFQRTVNLNLEMLESARVLGERAGGLDPVELRRFAARAVERHRGLRDLRWLAAGADPLYPALQEQARESGRMRATSLSEPEISVFLPVYDPPTGQFRGFLVALVDLAGLVGEASAGSFGDVRDLRVEIDDEQEGAAAFVALAPEGKLSTEIGPGESEIDLAGRSGVVRAVPTEAYVASRRASRPALALLGGVVATLLLACVMTTLGRRTSAVERLVAERTTDLSRQKALLESVLDNLGDGVAVADERGRLVMFNPAAEQILGVGAIDSGPTEWSELYGLFRPDSETRVAAEDLPLARAVAGFESRDVELFVRNPMREQGLFIRVTATPLRNPDGSVRGGVAIFRDITESRWSEMALRDSEERFRSMVEATDSALVILAPGHQIAEFNPEAERIYGRRRDDVVGRDYLELFVPREYREVVAEDIRKALSGKTTAELEIPVCAGDGGTRLLLLGISRLTSLNGKIEGVVATGHDITERREAEEAQRVRQLAAHLQAAREGERKHAAREIHDELGQVLTGLKFEFSHLARRLQDVDPEVQSEIASLERLIDSTIGSVRRIAAELRPQILDQLGLLEAIRWQAREFEKRTGISCTLDLPIEEIEWSPERSTAVFRIFQESLTNVARHSGAASVRVRVQHREDQLELEIADDGRGIREHELANARSFGLMGMRERARMFGGVLSVHGARETGTTVRVQIPV